MLQVQWYCNKCQKDHFGNCPMMSVTMTTATSNDMRLEDSSQDDDTPASPPYWKENGQIILDEPAQGTIEDKLYNHLHAIWSGGLDKDAFEYRYRVIQALITTQTTQAKILAIKDLLGTVTIHDGGRARSMSIAKIEAFLATLQKEQT